MAKHIVIERPNGMVTIVRSELETASESELTEHEQIINELWTKLKNLTMHHVSISEAEVCQCKFPKPSHDNTDVCTACGLQINWQT